VNLFFNNYKNLSIEIYKISFVRFIFSMGNFIYPFLTLFMVKKLGLSPQLASIYIIISGFTFLPGSIISGKIADKYGRKKILVFAVFIYLIIIFSVFFIYHFKIITNKIIAVLLIIANIFISMTYSPISAVITDVTTPLNRNEAFSLTYFATNVGFAFGPLIAGFLFENYTSMIFFGNGLFSLIGFFVLLSLKETKPLNFKDLTSNFIEKERANLSEENLKINNSVIKFILKDMQYLLFILTTIFYYFAYSQVGFTLPIYLSNLFSQKGAKIYGFLQSTNAITVILLTPIISNLTNRKPPLLMVAIAGIFYAVGFGLYGIFRLFLLFIFSTVIWSIGEIIQIINQNIYIANKSPINLRAQMNSIFQILSGIGFLLGPIFSGFFQKKFDISFIWLLVFIVCLAGTLQLIVSYKKNN